MDKKQFLDQLSAVAELRERKPKTTPNIRLDDSDINDIVWEGQAITIGKHSNPTLGVEIVKFNSPWRACDLGCGQTVKDQVVEHRLCAHPEPHWRTRCNSCEKFLGPDGQFYKGGHVIQNLFVQHFKSRNK